jgi:DNA-binding MarR family transcriptional regulator
MFVLGLGLGLVMQVLVLAVQNAVDYHDLGVATSGATLFRSIGGSVGTAALGAVFSNRLADNLAGTPGAGRLSGGTLDPAAIARLPAAIHDAFIHAFTDSLNTVFLVAAAIAAVAFALSLLLDQLPLRDTVATAGVREAFATPTDARSLPELARELSTLSRREGAQRIIERAAARAGVDLDAGGCWLLARFARDPGTDPHALARERDLDAGALAAIAADLELRGLVTRGDGAHVPTAAGRQALDRLTATSQQRLNEIAADWHPERYPELAALILALAREFLLDPSALPMRAR